MNRMRPAALRAGFLLVAMTLAGCANVLPSPQEPVLAAAQRIDADDTVTVQVEVLPGVVVLDQEKQRLTQTVQERVGKRASSSLPDARPQSCRLVLRVSRYDHGNAFKRSVRAGMGEMYIDAQVEVYAADGGQPEEKIGDFPVHKVYGWGGAMGAQATIAALEEMLGDTVAAMVVSIDQPKVQRGPGYRQR